MGKATAKDAERMDCGQPFEASVRCSFGARDARVERRVKRRGCTWSGDLQCRRGPESLACPAGLHVAL